MQVQDNKAVFGTPGVRRPRKRHHAARGTGSVYETGGRWIATQPMPGQRPKKFYGKTQKEAVDKRTDWMVEVAQGVRDSSGQSGRIGDTKLVYLSDWVDHWLEHVVKPVYDPHSGDRIKGLQPTTYENYRWHVQRHIRPILGSVKLVELRLSHVENWYDQLRQEGVAITCAYEAHRRLVIALNAALERSEETHLTHNAAKGFTLRPPWKKTKPAPDPEVLVRVLDTAVGDRMELAVHLALYLGLRRQEIAALQWRDFDLVQGKLLIRRRANRLRKQGVRVRRGSKMADEEVVQTIQIDPSEWSHVLGAHRQRTLEFYAKNRSRWSGLDPRDEAAFLFTGRRGQVLDPTLVSLWVGKLLERGGHGGTVHGLRHDFVGILADSGASLLEISRAARHANTSVTDKVYTHLTDEHSRKVVGKVGKWLDQARLAADETTG
jgi:integrase